MSHQPRIVVATGNAHKTEEIAAALARQGCAVTVVSARELGGMPEVDENGNTFEANARLKVEALQAKAGTSDWILADDSGLEVEVLDGAPGIYSARYAGPNATDADNNAKLLRELGCTPSPCRKARFVCTLVLLGGGVDAVFNGVCAGRMLEQAAGNAGFGYDPLFVPDDYEQTFAELGSSVKDEISHRARACQQLAGWLNARK
ncbi:MAG: RdgB/HAM1 family non-canonical purine NTP pyrophosphatase [Verrucomicrobiota bacterium]